MVSTPPSPVAQMARWLATVQSHRIPDAVRDVARRAVIDTIGVSIAGSATPVAARVREVAISCGAAGDASVFGVGHGRFHPTTAALANGAAAHALDFDDNSYAGFVHASAVVVPTALAMTQAGDGSGRDWLDAYIVGAECQFALADALGRAPYDAGWWTTSLFGSVGACAAACYALRLDATTTAAALGLAVTAANGSKAGFGTDAKPIMVGRTAQGGIVNALLAASGCRGPVNAIESDSGLAALVSDGQCDTAVFAALGQTWRLQRPGIDIKRIPVCLASHAAVEALKTIIVAKASREAISPNDIAAHIDRIVCDVPPIVIKNLAYALPSTPQQAQFSMPFAMAATAFHGDVNRVQLQQAVIDAPSFIAMMQRVAMLSSGRWRGDLIQQAPEGAWVRVDFSDGTTTETFCAMPTGSAARPLSAAQLGDKFLDCVTPVWGEPAAEVLLTQLSTIDNCGSVRSLFTSLPV